MFFLSFFFFNDPATTGIYPYWHPLSLHDALPICLMLARHSCRGGRGRRSLSRRGLSGPTTRLTTLRARSRIRTILTSTGSGWRVTWRWAEIGGWQHEDLLEQLARDAGPAIGLGSDVTAHGNGVGVRLSADRE